MTQRRNRAPETFLFHVKPTCRTPATPTQRARHTSLPGTAPRCARHRDRGVGQQARGARRERGDVRGHILEPNRVAIDDQLLAQLRPQLLPEIGQVPAERATRIFRLGKQQPSEARL